MGERITRIPFKELPSSGDDLEAHLLELQVEEEEVETSTLLPYNSLPNRLQVSAIEELGNSHSVATQKDLEREERGSWVHLQKSPRNLITPSIPTVGYTTYAKEQGMVFQQVTPERYVTHNLYPLAFVHSHPGPDTFSAGDIYLAMGEDQSIKPVATIAATTNFNYLLLRSQDSTTLQREGIPERMRAYEKELWQEGLQYNDRFIPLMLEEPERFYHLLESFGSDAHDFFINMAIVQTFADEEKYGFYFSRKDGDYQLLSQNKVRELLDGMFTEDIVEEDGETDIFGNNSSFHY